MDPLGVLADSFRDALACGAAFAARGARVLVALPPGGPNASVLPRPAPWDVLVMTLADRDPAPEAWRPAAKAGAQALRQSNWPLGLLHASATPPERLGAVVDELLKLGVARAWIALGDRPATPVFPSTCEPVGRLARATLDEGTPAVAQQARIDRFRGCPVIVSEAATPRHLKIMARLLREREIAEPRELLVGADALALQLAAALLPDAIPGAPLVPEMGALEAGGKTALAALRDAGVSVLHVLGEAERGKIVARAEGGSAAGRCITALVP